MLNRLYLYGVAPNSHDLLKVVATIFMMVDHIGLFFYSGELGFRVLGRIAAPLFFFLVGYVKPSRFTWSLVFYGVIITCLSYVTKQHIYLNILLNFVLIKTFLRECEPHKMDNGDLILLMNLLILLNPFCFLYLEYGTSGLFFATAARLLAEKDPRSRIWLIAAIVHHFIYESLGFHFIAYPLYLSATIVIALLLLFIMWHYRMRTWKIPFPLNIPVLFISRYSLPIYFWHLAILKCYSSTPLLKQLSKIWYATGLSATL